MSEATSTPAMQVVVNDEDQYSLWPADSTPPAGWRPEGFVGNEEAALDHIAVIWTDMRPKSLRDTSTVSE
ncbi:MbtH family protein [Streptomyces alkaliphilus]|uniref:MbtH family protein n=1 Tax=Streptomyces alkaliphilus TaxID=1472722 RepID=UPI00117D40EA|nr:MbtH family NRPS accessory protein [Streptomyces alkaliphilus]MQS05662.1 MbtH family NRPS accessory protein [Streptomyces alkaliphilus]